MNPATPTSSTKTIHLAVDVLLTDLRAYFSSGWAFLIPYLLTYLLYAWRKWPANPVTGGQLPVTGDSLPSTVLSSPSSVFGLPIPPLLYVYWALHAINLVLAALAMRRWWKNAQSRAVSDKLSVRNSEGLTLSSQLSTLNLEATATPAPSRLAPNSNLSGFRFQLSAFFRAASPALPWLLLALLFAIPGVYLEWPSDPWEHLRRITEWATHPVVANHSAGYKSFYFFAYSWVGWLSPVHLLSSLNVYYTAVCLLLAWQYYLLAKAVGLDRRWAFLSVIVNVLTFGNVCFSFYRYYALASTIFAQIGAVALTRIALEYAKGIGQSDCRLSTVDSPEEQPRATIEGQESKALLHGIRKRLPVWFRRPQSTSARQLSTVSPHPIAWAQPIRDSLLTTRYSLLRSAAAGAALLLLIAFNHIQGIGIAGLGVAAVILWRVIEWKRSIIFWLGAIAVVLSFATVLWWPRQPQIDAVFRPGGWLNAWYGFNLAALPSPAADRMMYILGLFGLLNLVVGVILLRHNHVVGWLTITPVVALSLPFIAIPFANSIATEIIVYHRLFFAIPAGLVLVCLIDQLKMRARLSVEAQPPQTQFLALTLVMVLLVCLPPQSPFNHRLWNLLSVIPDDLQMKSIVLGATPSSVLHNNVRPIRLATARFVPSIFNTVDPGDFPYCPRSIGKAVTAWLNDAMVFAVSGEHCMGVCIQQCGGPAQTVPWVALSGSPPQIVPIDDLSISGTAIQNPPGFASHAFTLNFERINADQKYTLKVSVRQRSGPQTKAFLAVAWYDEMGRLLESEQPSPLGAGSPVGWQNGTYSYFGLIEQAPPIRWKTFSKSFGRGEQAEVPKNARFLRLGALLNYHGIPGAVVQITPFRLYALPDSRGRAEVGSKLSEQVAVIAPSPQLLFTAYSQTSRASGHWPANQAAFEFAGSAELAIAAQTLSVSPITLIKAHCEPP